MPITYIKGDATRPVGDGQKMIVHVCNDIGAWGAGFVLAISNRWPAPEDVYRRAFRTVLPRLGDIQIVPVEPSIIVCNMIAQRGVAADRAGIPLQYDALRLCLKKAGNIARKWNCSVHMPRIGCGLAGGTWDKVEPLIKQALEGVSANVYDL